MVQIIKINDNDKLLIEVNYNLSQEQIDSIEEGFCKFFELDPNNIITYSKNIINSIEVVRK